MAHWGLCSKVSGYLQGTIKTVAVSNGQGILSILAATNKRRQSHHATREPHDATPWYQRLDYRTDCAAPTPRHANGALPAVGRAMRLCAVCSLPCATCSVPSCQHAVSFCNHLILPFSYPSNFSQTACQATGFGFAGLYGLWVVVDCLHPGSLRSYLPGNAPASAMLPGRCSFYTLAGGLQGSIRWNVSHGLPASRQS